MSAPTEAEIAQIKQWLAECSASEPLDPATDARWVDLDDVVLEGGIRGSLRGEDHTRPILDCISFLDGGSCQLFSGFSGTGKTTELKRLAARLRDAGYTVLYADALDYHDLRHPLRVEEFIPILAGAFGEAATEVLGADATSRGFFEEFADFLRSEVKVEGFSKLDVKASLKSPPDAQFWADVRTALAQSIGTLKKHAHDYIERVVARLRTANLDSKGVVFLFDSLEKLRGGFSDYLETIDSVVHLLTRHHDILHLPGCHAVISVPAFAEILQSEIAAFFHGPIHTLPAVRVSNPSNRTPHSPGIEALREVVARRVDIDRLFAERRSVDELAWYSGGHVRTLIEMLWRVLIRSGRVGLPVSADVVSEVIAEFVAVRSRGVRPEDMAILESVERTRSLDEVARDQIPNLARSFESHIVLSYRNGKPWYDVHPMIVDDLLRRVRRSTSQMVPGDGG